MTKKIGQHVLFMGFMLLGLLGAGGLIQADSNHALTPHPPSPSPLSQIWERGEGVPAQAAGVRGEGSLQVPLTIRDTAGLSHAAEPVTSGIPLPFGAISDANNLWLAGPDGTTPAPAQFTVLSRWNGLVDDATKAIKWILVDFQADVPANATTTYYLRGSSVQQALGSRLDGSLAGWLDGSTPLTKVIQPSSHPTIQPSNRPAIQTSNPTLTVTDNGTHVIVDTGPLRFQVRRGPFNLFDGAWLDLDGNNVAETEVVSPGHAGGMILTRTNGSTYLSSADTADTPQVAVERNGPLHAVIRIEGRHTTDSDNGTWVNKGGGRPAFNYLEYTVRIHAYAGKPWVRVSYSIRYPDRFLEGEYNCCGNPVRHEWDGLRLRLPTNLDKETRRQGDERKSGKVKKETRKGQVELRRPLLPLRTFSLFAVFPSSPHLVSGSGLTYALGGEAPVSDEYPNKLSDPAAGTAVVTGTVPAGSSAELYQDSSGVVNWDDSADGLWGTTFRGYKVYDNGTEVASGLQSAGWGSLEGPAWGVSAGVRHFWQNFPKGIELHADGTVDIELWPERFRIDHRFAGGRQKTHEILIGFHTASPSQLAIQRRPEPVEGPSSHPAISLSNSPGFLSSFSAPLHATAPSTWYRNTLALGLISVEGDPNDPVFSYAETAADAVVEYAGPSPGTQGDIWKERFDADLYGWRNWGDSYRAGWKDVRYFGNNEFDFGYDLLLQYLRQADHDPRFFALGESMARHLHDIDVYHTGEDAISYSHGVHKHDASGIVDHSREPNMSHFWVRGLLTYYLLTGDRFALDAAEETAVWMDTLIDDNTGELMYHGETRSQAWPALALTELWEVTGKAEYLQWAHDLLHAEVIEEQGLAGATYPCPDLDWQGGKGVLNKSEVAVWQNGYVSEALGRYATAMRLLGGTDPEAEQALFRLLDAIESCGWATPDNGKFVAGDPSKDNVVYNTPYQMLALDRIYSDGAGGISDYKISFPINQVLTNGYAYGALLSPNPADRERYRQMAYDTWTWTMGPETQPGNPQGYPYYCCPGTPAKNTAYRLRFGQVYLWLKQLLDADSQSPVIENVQVVDVTDKTATVAWTVSGDATGWVEYGLDQSYGRTSDYPTTLGNQQVTLTNLQPDTTHHFRIAAKDLAGNTAATGDFTFTTEPLDVTPPTFSNVTFSEPTDTSVRVSWDTDEPATTQIEYGTTTAYGNTTPLISTLTLTHTQVISGLLPGTAYHLRLLGQDLNGNAGASSDFSFTTYTPVTVTLQEGLDGYVGAADTTLDGYDTQYKPMNFGGRDWFRIWDTGTRRGIVRFDLTGLPAETAGLLLLRADLELYAFENNWSSDTTVRAYRVTRDWVEGDGWYGQASDGATWYEWDYFDNNATSTNDWASYGGDYDTTSDWGHGSNGIVDEVSAAWPAWMRWDVTELARAWLDGSVPNHGLLLMGTESGNDLRWRSSEHSTVSERPRLALIFGQGGSLPASPIVLENGHVRLSFQQQSAGSQTWGLGLESATVKSTSYSFGFDLDDLWAITLRATDATTTTLTPSTASSTLNVVTSTTGLTQTLTAVWQDVTPAGETRGQGDKETRRQGDLQYDRRLASGKSPCLPFSPSPCLKPSAVGPAVATASLTVTATVTLGPDDPYALWTIAVDNRYPDQAVYHVDFPRLKIRPVGTPTANRAVIPYFGGRIINDPIHSSLQLLPAEPPFFQYPHMFAPLQLFTYFDTTDAHALYLATHDGAGYTKHFDFRSDGQRLHFRVRQFPEYNITPGNDYVSPYPMALGALAGDWYDAAKLYRAWSLQQTWAQRGPIALSDDFSDKLKASDVMGVWTPITDTLKPFEAVAQDMERWKDFLGIEHVAGLWYGWHGNAFDTGWPEYEPVEPSFSDGVTLTHSLGNYVWPYILPIGWDTATASYTSTHAADYAMKDESGNVQTVTTPPGATFAIMDPATSFWQTFVRDWVLDLQTKYDVDGVYLDVWSGGGAGFDYDPSHGHPTGGGNYIAQGMRTQGQMIRQAARANDPGFIMMSEHPGEMVIDELEIENVEYVGPLNPAQWWTIPLFNTVYHDYITMSTFVNTSAGLPDDPETETALAYAWAVRYTQGNLLAVNGDGAAVLQDPVESTPNYGSYLFLRELVQSYAYARPYLRYGERLRDLPVEVGTLPPPSANGVPFTIVPYGPDQPAIMSSVWRSVTDPSTGPSTGSGGTSGYRDSVGLVLTNWITTTQAISYTFDPGEYGLPATALGLYRLDEAGPHLITSFTGPLTRSETLPRRSVVLLMVAPCPHPYDLSGNGVVDAEDIAIVAANWGLPNPDPRADLNGDGHVDVKDVMRASAAWGAVCPITPPSVDVQIVGPEEVVFDWTTDRCEDTDIPDVPARAFRDAQGQVQLIASHYVNRRMVGPDLDQLTHDCGVIMSSHFNSDPAQFDDHEWIDSVYTPDGATVFALIHNEYQGHTHPGQCPSGQYTKCWYNTVTLATSTDGGDTYTHAQPPTHLVASIPYVYVPDTGPAGIFSPSNIIYNAADGYYYALLHLEQYQAQEWGACVMRTTNLADPTSWRAWNGTGFNVRFINPYTSAGLSAGLEPNEPPENHVCQPVSRNEIAKMHASLTFNTHLDRYLLVGTAGLFDPGQGKTVWGVYYSLSDDLIHWTPRQLIMEAPMTWSWQPGDPDPIAYPAVLDPDSESDNFETTGKRMYLYFTRFHYADGHMTLDRDLVRVPMEFSQ
ncbi:MAG: DUF6259 domain-containing protein [Anaerolineae bacterium]